MAITTILDFKSVVVFCICFSSAFTNFDEDVQDITVIKVGNYLMNNVEINQSRNKFSPLQFICQTIGCNVTAMIKVKDTEKFIALKPYPDTQCIDVITSFITPDQCELPPYCGQTVYMQTESTWYGVKIGVCLGIGQNSVLYWQPDTIPGMPHGWCRLLTVEHIAQPPTAGHLLFDILHCYDDNYYTISPKFINQYPMMTSQYKLIPPKIKLTQGKQCIPSISFTSYPYLFGPFEYEIALGYSVVYPYPTHTLYFCYDYYICSNEYSNYLQLNYSSMSVSCDASRQTLGTLDIVYSYLTKIVSHCFYSISRTLYILLVRFLSYLLQLLFHLVDPFLLFVCCLFQFYYTQRSVFDVIIIALIISAFYNITYWLRVAHYNDIMVYFPTLTAT